MPSDPTRPWLRAEGAAALAASLWAYGTVWAGWLLFAVLLLAPDLAMLGYLRGPRAGAVLYNAAHSYVAPATLAAVGVLAAVPLAVPLALIWTAHIGLDRMLGYGLKRPTGFGDTHLGTVGRGG